MKKLSYLLLMLLLPAFVLVGCSDDNNGDDNGGKQIELPDQSEQTQQGYADDETTGGFTFTAKSAWTATVLETTTSRASSVSWLRLLHNGTEKYEGGAGTFTLTIEIAPNHTGKTRTATIDITSGTDKITVTVTQEGTTENGDIPDPDPDPDPSADKSDVIITALNNTANSTALTVRATETLTTGWPHNEDKTTVTWLAYNVTSRKCVEYRKTTDNKTTTATTDHIKYLEGDYVYYSQAGSISGAKRYKCAVEPALFWDKFNHSALISYLKYFCDLPPRDWSKYTWTVNGNEYTATYTANNGNFNEEIKIMLDGTRVISMKLKSLDVTNVVNEIERTKEITFEQTASPAFPEGFSAQDFEAAEQNFLKVVWGENLGENTFYSGYNYSGAGYIGAYSDEYGISPEAIRAYAPVRTGKRAEYYFDAAFTERVEMGKPIYINDNDTVIYVKWVTA